MTCAFCVDFFGGVCLYRIFGNYLLRNLGPVERERVDWDYILGVRCVDLMLGSLIWKRVDGMTRKDGGELSLSFFSLSLCFVLCFS